MREKKIFRDPIYNFISFDKQKDKVLLELIETPEVQRLKRIKQLGVSSFTYPSAVHNRFCHSLGVAYLVGIVYDRLNVEEKIIVEDTDGKHEIKKDEFRLLLQITGLLHDLGHGPFSHAFENIDGEFKFKHESMTVKLLQRDSISSILNNGFKRKLLNNKAVKWVGEIINKTFSVGWAKELISSQIDLDRIDYLLRDAYMCGVEYVNFDYEWLLHNMTIGRITNEGNREGLLIDAKKGVHSLESFIMSRYHMYEQVYYHKTTNCFVIILKLILKRLMELSKSDDMVSIFPNDNNLLEFFNNQNNLDAFLAIDDNYILFYIGIWARSCKDEILKELSNCFINRKPYKMQLQKEDDNLLCRKDHDYINSVFNNDKIKRDYFCVEDSYNINPYKDNYLLGNSTSEEAEHIWLLDKDNHIIELSEKSEVIKLLRNNTTKTNRLYIHKDYMSSLSTLGENNE